MRTRKLRELEVSEIGMGCMGFSHGYGTAPDRDYSIEAIRDAFSYGCNFSLLINIVPPNILIQSRKYL